MARVLGILQIAGTTPGLILVHFVYGIGFTTPLFSATTTRPSRPSWCAPRRSTAPGFFQIFWRIMLPSSGPIIAVSFIWQFTNIWNDFLFGASFRLRGVRSDDRGAEQPRQLVHGRARI